MEDREKLLELQFKVQQVQTDIKNLDEKVLGSILRLEQSIQELKDRPNPLVSFWETHGKLLLTIIIILLGADIAVLEVLYK
jgi:hypothetical protein